MIVKNKKTGIEYEISLSDYEKAKQTGKANKFIIIDNSDVKKTAEKVEIKSFKDVDAELKELIYKNKAKKEVKKNTKK
jgi:hypothetical protein